jgi:glycerophosphoryl diester phosphodiesterase
MRAFDLAIALGADALELDVRRSLDGELVVIHDATLDRTTSSRGTVASRQAAELAAVDARFGTLAGQPPPDRPESIPLLRDVFARYVRLEITVDVKDPAATDAVVRLIEEYDRIDRTILYVENGTRLPAFRTYAGRTATSTRQALWLAMVGRWLPGRGGATFPEVVHSPMRRYGLPVISPGLIRSSQDVGRTVQVWTVDDPETTTLLAAWGVDGIITNDVRAAVGLLDSASP